MIDNTKREMPVKCPSCGQTLKVGKLNCCGCGTAVEGNFNLSVLSQLNSEDQNFILTLIKSSGSLKDVAAFYGVSYPTVRNMLDSVIEKVKLLEAPIKKNKED